MADKLHVTLNECVHDQPAFSVKTSYKNKRRSDALVSRLDLDQHSEPKRAQTSTFAEVLWLPARWPEVGVEVCAPYDGLKLVWR